MSESEPIAIRRGTAADDVLLAEIGAETFRDTFAADNTPEDMAHYLAQAFGPERQAMELADPTSTFLIAESGDATLGYARLTWGPSPVEVGGTRPVDIARFYVRRPWIGRGVARVLMEACLDEARRAESDVVWLTVWEHNHRAMAFYAKWGFVAAGDVIFMLGNDRQRDLLLKRSL
jgi:GNAT superfamily N-acetyltransferase